MILKDNPPTCCMCDSPVFAAFSIYCIEHNKMFLGRKIPPPVIEAASRKRPHTRKKITKAILKARRKKGRR